MKKIVLLILVLVMIIACGDNSSNEVKETTIRIEETTEEITFKLPDYDFNGYKFNILTAAEQWIQYYYAENENGDIINDSVYARNRAVEELYNINLNYQVYNGYNAGMDSVATALRGAVNAATGEFDLMIAGIGYYAPRILEGLFIDMYKVDTINYEYPWWLDKINNSTTIANKAYTVAGSYALNSMTGAWGVFFNKKLINDFELEVPYDLVNSGKWTFDKMLELGSQVYADLNGNSERDKDDRYGLITGAGDICNYIRYALGTTITKYDSNGYPVLDGASERMVIVYDKLKALYYSDEYVYNFADIDIREKVIMFTDNRALFYSYAIRLAEDTTMRDFEEYGIVPQPKFDEKQSDYYALCGGDSYSILLFSNDESMSGAVLEALNMESYLNVIPSYYNIALQRKFIRDDESSAMLDIILDGRIYDFGAMYSSSIENGIYNIRSLIMENKEFTSWWASNEAAIQKNMEKLIEQLKELQ
ncbi:MAG: extracellular solute-binding protein [Oscillospiraceae bacterium]|nr:extracellular solute-binding protein [Oscillospiraceae bacterium]